MTQKRIPLPPVEVLEEWFRYDETTGALQWKKRRARRTRIGDEAGWVRKDGYREVTFGDHSFKVHRIIFKMFTGLEPPFEIDHRDGDTLNNRLSNLRVSGEKADNGANAKVRTDNTSGEIGVSWGNRDRMWIGSINRRGVRHQAYFQTKEEAISWRLQKEVELHGEFAQHRRNKPEQENK